MEFDSSGKYIRSIADDLFVTPHSLRVDNEDNLWTTDVGAHVVLKLSPEGRVLLTLGRMRIPGDDVLHFIHLPAVPELFDLDDRHREAVAFLQREPIRSLDHYAIFERSTATAAKLSEAKAPQRKTLLLCNSAAHHKRTREGDSLRAIARALHVSNNTVAAIREQQWQQVAARKERIAAQCELNATLAAERMTDKLLGTGDIPLNTLVPAFGVSVDKLALLRGHAPSVNIANIVLPTEGARRAPAYSRSAGRHRAQTCRVARVPRLASRTRVISSPKLRFYFSSGG